MCPDKLHLFLFACLRDGVAQDTMQLVEIRVRPPRPGPLRNPGRELEDRSDDADKLLAGKGVDLLQPKSGFVHRSGRFITPGMATGKLIHQRYGKARVRLLKIFRRADRHDIKEVDVSIQLQGDFAAAYTAADNRLVVPTDTMKNIVQVLAHEHLGSQLEPFGVLVGQHFLARYPQVARVTVMMAEMDWRRLSVEERPHEHSFVSGGSQRRFMDSDLSREGIRVESGIEDLALVKSTGSGFAGFPRDEFTTLLETQDRILATRLTGRWLFERQPPDYGAVNESILAAMLKAFALNYSPSVQATLYQMAEAALSAAPEIAQVTLTMPNLHCLPVDLKPFGRENRNELFVPTQEPQGVIEATIAR